MTGDLGDFLRVNAFARHTGWLHTPARLYAEDGIALFALALLAAFWLARREGEPTRTARAVLAPVAVLVAVALNQPIVHALNEPRPFVRAPHALVLVHRSTDASFPSDHATMAGAVAIGVLLVAVRLGIAVVAGALLMAADRVYVGAHYPVDVLAGLLVGGTVAAVVVLGGAPFLTSLVARLQHSRLRLLLQG